MNVNERLARVETQMENISKLGEDTRNEMRQFRHDLFSLLNPLMDRVSKVETHVGWMQKSKRWSPVLKLGSITGLAAAVAELARLFYR